MRSWLQGIKREHVMTMLVTIGLIGFAAAAEAAVAGGGIGQWAPMGTAINSTQGTPAQALTTGMGMGAAFRVMMGDVGPGIVGVGCVGGGGWLATHCADAFNAWGVTGALAKAQAITAVLLS